MKKFISLIALLLITVLLGCNSNNKGITSNDETELNNFMQNNVVVSNQKRVVGYMPSWSGTAEEINYKGLTHIIYSFAIPNEDGSLKPLEGGDKLAKIVSLAHANGVKVSLAVGGWSDNGQMLDGRFEALASTAAGRERLVADTMALYDKYNLDGVDLDWEYPDPGTSASNYNALMTLMRQELDLRGGLLSAAVMGGVTESGQVLWGAAGITDEALAMMDMVNIMAYDSSNGNHSSYEWSINCYRYWNETRSVPSVKLNLGVPFYARPSWAAYKNIVAANPQAPYSDYDSNFGYYNGIATIKKKTQFVIDNFAGGVMIWEISQDTHDDTSLIKAINDTLGNNTEPTVDELIALAEGELLKLPANKVEADAYQYNDLKTLEGLVANAQGAVDRAIAKGANTASIASYDRLGIANTRITELKAQAPQYPAWDKGTVYLGGDRVTHEGVNYEAKWWSQGDVPGSTQWGPWKELVE